MNGNMPEDVYCTLLLNDAYLPGVQVLAHSLRDGGTTKRLAIMVVLGGVSNGTVVELKKLYDYVIPVDPHYSRSPENLSLMNRLDLNVAMTKIELWKQTQFRKVVYVDADILALRSPDELFDVDADFAACPDVGWPDCFNSGMMVVKPNMDTYQNLVNLAGKGESYDGADQGLLNQYFENWHRLSFTYNCTVGGNMAYQYAPALRYYGSKVSMVHFIGGNKPWDRGNVPGFSSSTNAYDKFSGHWWSVYNKHHNSASKQVGLQGQSHQSGGFVDSRGTISNADFGSTANRSFSALPQPIQNYNSVGAYGLSKVVAGQVNITGAVHLSCNKAARTQSDNELKFVPIRSVDQPSKHSQTTQALSTGVQNQISPTSPTGYPGHRIIIGTGTADGPPTHHQNYVAEGRLEEFVLTRGGPVSQDRYFRTGAWTYYVQDSEPDNQPILDEGVHKTNGRQFAAWDPTKFAPPQHGPPEADKLSVQFYENEWDTRDGSSQPFIAPDYTPPSKLHLWYDIPQPASGSGKVPSAKPIFPWEEKPRQASRVFHDSVPSKPDYPEENDSALHKDTVESSDPLYHLKPVFPWEQRPRTVTRVFAGDEGSNSDPQSERGYEEDGDDEFLGGRFPARENRWDTDPAIRDYILGLKTPRSRVPVKNSALSTVSNEFSQSSPAPIEHMVQTDEYEENQEQKQMESDDTYDKTIKTEYTGYSDSSMQTEPLALSDSGTQHGNSTALSDIGTQYGNPMVLTDIGTQYGNPLTLSDIGTQYGNSLALSDSGTQYGYDGDETDVLVEDDEDDDSDGPDMVVTPKSSTLGLSSRYRSRRFSFGKGDDIHGRKSVVRGRSIDSALGSTISDEI